MKFFTADLHFGADYILTREFRPFKTTEECGNVIVNNINSRCGKYDTLYIIGDLLTFNSIEQVDLCDIKKFVERINPKIILIKGNGENKLIETKYNNDAKLFEEYARNIDISEVKDDAYLEIDGNKVYLNHYPSKEKPDYINLFGHIHKNMLFKKYGINVGIDLFSFFPVSEEQVMWLWKKKSEFYDRDNEIACFNISETDKNKN